MCLIHVALTKNIQFLNPASANVENKTLQKQGILVFVKRFAFFLVLVMGIWNWQQMGATLTFMLQAWAPFQDVFPISDSMKEIYVDNLVVSSFYSSWSMGEFFTI